MCAANSPQIGTPQIGGSPRRRMDQLEQSHQPDGGDESFVVHRGKTVPTLYNVVTGGEGATPRGSRVAAIKERFNMDTKAEERGEDRSSSGPAGVPSNWEDRKSGTSYAGRRSRRNSITDDSHLTIENFGGSQDNLSMFGRNPDKEPVTLQQSGRRPSIDAFTPDSIPPAAGTPSTPAGVNYWRRNNDRTRSQVFFVLKFKKKGKHSRCSSFFRFVSFGVFVFLSRSVEKFRKVFTASAIWISGFPAILASFFFLFHFDTDTNKK